MDTLSAHKNLKLLMHLRNVAILGQAAAVLFVVKVLSIPLPVAAICTVLLLSCALNLFTWQRIRTAERISEHEFFMQLLLDMAALFGVLYFSGGATNPFATLFILQVVIAAVTLPPRFSWIAAFIAAGLYTSLFFYKVEVPYFLHHHLGDFFSLHVQGMWISFLLLACIVCWFIVQMNASLRRQEALLAEASQMAALGTFAAGAAHELGTPLATLAILAENCDAATQSRMQEQLVRCKQILSGIAAAGGVMRAEGGQAMGLTDFLTQLCARWRADNPQAALQELISGNGNPRILAEESLRHAITNLLDNAADASPESVSLFASWNEHTLSIHISDKGDGLPQLVQKTGGNIGLTTKPDGMGLGLVLARSIISRLEGSLDLSSVKGDGTDARISLPLKRLGI